MIHKTWEGKEVDESKTPLVVKNLALLFAFAQTGSGALKGWWNYVECAREALRIVEEEGSPRASKVNNRKTRRTS